MDSATILAATIGTALSQTMSAGSGGPGPSGTLSPVSSSASALIKTGTGIAKDQGSHTWLGLFGRLILWVLQLASTIVYYALKLITISTPTFLYTFFSTSLTVTMNMTTLAVIIGLLFGAATWIVRYRYLNMYSRLPPEPQRKEPEIDLFPDTHEEGIKSGLASYFDEFLSAIKIFGYLERPVFHELTRSMQTRKLIAGETLNLEDEKGFCLVVDGLVEIFVKSSRDSRRGVDGVAEAECTSGEEETFTPGHQRYQLLTEVRNGAPMSSLFSIMSLFTEDIQLRQPEDDTPEPVSGTGSSVAVPTYPLSADFRKSLEIPVSFPNSPRLDGVKKDHTTNLPNSLGLQSTAQAFSNVPPLSLDATEPARPPRRPIPKRNATSSAHPDIIARATVDTTIAIIPASAFRRLIRIYPKATAHIVHVILSRFQRVTLATAYQYLGLTGEVLQIERNMLKYTTRQLPNHLRGDALDRLKEKFNRERERIGEGEDVGKGIALHNAHTGRRRRSTNTLRKEATLQAFTRQRQMSMGGPSALSFQERPTSVAPSPGDLSSTDVLSSRSGGQRPSSMHISNVQNSQGDPLKENGMTPLTQRPFNPFATQRNVGLDKREAVDEDNIFRESILDCMFKSIGLTGNSTGHREPDSAQGSPKFVSYDQRRQKAVFTNNAFGFMDAFEGSADGDSESITSGFTNSPVNTHLLTQDMKDEVEIVFFPKGSVLVEQGERNPGLYYIIDGFLDVSIQVEDSPSDILQSSKSSMNAMESAQIFGSSARSTSSSRFSVQEMGQDSAESRKKGKKGRRSVALIKPGGLAGYIGTISSYRSFIDVVAKTDVYVGFLPRSSIERIVDRYPTVLLTMAKRLTNLLPRLILHIDFALEWLQVNAGQVLFHEGDESEAIYIVLNGRLRSVADRKDGGVNVRAEFGQGESIGELEVLTESSRAGTLHAIRDTEVVKFPRTLFNSLAQEHPNITIKISKIIASRMRALVDDPSALGLKDTSTQNVNKSSSTLNLRTVAILPVTAGVPVVEFGNRLMNALAQVGTPNGATSLNQAAILNHLGKHAFNRIGKLKLSQYLADLEEKYSLVVYVAGKSLPLDLFFFSFTNPVSFQTQT